MRRADGSFSIAARFDAPATALAEVEAQVNRAISTRTQRDGAPFDTEFVARPRVQVEGNTILVVFEARPEAKYWKDWLVGVAQDVDGELEGISFSEFFDVVAGKPTTP